jgi:hypothetical protein
MKKFVVRGARYNNYIKVPTDKILPSRTKKKVLGGEIFPL